MFLVSIVDMTGAGMGDNPESILDNLRQLRPWPHLNPNRHSICLVAHTVTTYKTITKSKEEVLKIGFNLLWMGVLVGDRGINRYQQLPLPHTDRLLTTHA